jgi:flagellar basal body-associated protein FliL
MASNWFLFIGIFLIASGIGMVVGIIFVAIWMIGYIAKTMKTNDKQEADIVNNYVYEGDKVVNVNAKQGSKRYVFDDGKLEDWR